RYKPRQHLVQSLPGRRATVEAASTTARRKDMVIAPDAGLGADNPKRCLRKCQRLAVALLAFLACDAPNTVERNVLPFHFLDFADALAREQRQRQNRTELATVAEHRPQ